MKNSKPNLMDLPQSLKGFLGQYLQNKDANSLALTCTDFADALQKYLYREYRCLCCNTFLFHPRIITGRPYASFGATFQIYHVFSISETPQNVDILKDVEMNHPACFTQKIQGNAYKCKKCKLLIGYQEYGEHHICDWFIRRTKINGKFEENDAALHCRNCKHIVTYTEQILEPGHVWKLDHQYEAAALFNSVAPDGVNIGPAREEKLAQGWMKVADMSCAKCCTSLGWKFVGPVDGEGPCLNENLSQHGRYGFVISRLFDDNKL